MARVFPEREVKIASITIGQRHRKDMGDIDALAASIREKGLLQAIGVDPDHRLVFGERRLRAVRDVLKLATIRAVVVDAPALAVEHDENLIRKEFTPSERVAIAKALKEQLKEQVGERRGRPPKKAAEEIPGNCPEFGPEPGEETREAAARLAGFGDDRTLRRAEKVVEQGTPELVEAMDAGEVSINAAAEAAELPVEKQREVVEEVRAGKKASEATRKAKGEEGSEEKDEAGPSVAVDGWGIPIQPHAQEAFQAVPRFKELLALVRQAQKLFNELANVEGGKFLQLPDVSSYRRGKKGDDGEHEGRFVHEGLERAYQQIKAAMPTYTVCPWNYVDGPHPEDCRTCRQLNWTPVLGRSIPEGAIKRAKEVHGV